MASRRLLYVEDDDGAYFLIELAFREADPGIELFRARDGEQAMALLGAFETSPNTTPPDLILLDLNLPKQDGFAVLRTLKASESLRNIPVIVFTTSSRDSDRENSFALGAKAYVVKPSTLTALLEAAKAMARSTQ